MAKCLWKRPNYNFTGGGRTVIKVYNPVLGVPITFLNYHNPEQFDIIGDNQKGCHDLFPDIKQYDKYYEINYKTGLRITETPNGKKTNGNGMLSGKIKNTNWYIDDKGTDIVHSTYNRIFIRKRK